MRSKYSGAENKIEKRNTTPDHHRSLPTLVPTVYDNPEISFGGRGSLPVEGKPLVRWFNVEELQDGCGVFPYNIQPEGCIKNGRYYEYGYAQWEGTAGDSRRCYCQADGRYKCNRNGMGGKYCWNIN